MASVLSLCCLSHTAPDDFTALVAQTIQLTPENPTIDVQVEIEDDQLFEDAIESFFAELSNLVVENNADVTIDPATARVDIIDNESKETKQVL